MIVIGFNWPVEHDHTVAIIQDGRLVFASEEERFTRHKHSIGEPPINALKQAFNFLKRQGIKPKDVDAYAINYDPKLCPLKVRRWFYSDMLQSTWHLGIREGKGLKGYILHYLAGNYIDYAKGMIRKVIHVLGEEVPSDIKIYPVRHHLTHAASAYYFSGFNSATVLTIDGTGEYESTVIWKVKDGNFEPILPMWTSYGSIGSLYEYISQSLKFSFLEGPGKVMGLAPYGEKSKYYNKLKEIVKITPEGEKPYTILLDGKEIKTKNLLDIGKVYFTIANRVVSSIDWNPRGDLNENAVNVAWAIQKVTEEAVLATAKWAKDHTGEDKVALAGGVALNAKANMELYYSRLFNDMFIFPASNDAGGPIGAAAYVYEHVLGGKMKNERLTHVYLGPEYSDEEVKKVIERSKFKAEYVGDDVNSVADLIAKGQIVTWYQGRAELGPRALGHRSILADPTRKEYWRLVNDIKGREWWRPLAPSLLLEDINEYFKDPTKHEFMILMLRYKDEEACKRVPVTCHVDLTARPQTVTGQEDKNWYNVIKAFKDIKGEGLVMNTSFNLAGEPLVETPQDALRSFAFGGFDAMYMQGWLIRKK
ncbi:carbamoyltransferase [Acidianus sulfidivorans JP7]|uniref:Carbamoyltransferase n=1 Tax=Acidianus sulfidivorans JP7 TaxID=619593 RepID=A0A2U9IJP8_9CREN|nr:carbamoyltransferase C-terminal domain-containing protein [Acidianus sulfidivorans]AWR96240.1 carbamoyltransferase [Acidianus sulfidivorans JP7]